MTETITEYEKMRQSIILLRDSIKQRSSFPGDERILNDLDRVIDGMQQTTLTRMSNCWNELTFWQKLLGGIVVTSLPLTLNIVVNLSFCLTLAGVNAVTYTAGGLLLSDHNQVELSNQKQTIKWAKEFIFFASELLHIPLEELNIENSAAPNP